jgi:hypothetical protein
LCSDAFFCVTSCVAIKEAEPAPETKEVIEVPAPVDCEKEKAETKKRSLQEENAAAWDRFTKKRPKGESTTLDVYVSHPIAEILDVIAIKFVCEAAALAFAGQFADAAYATFIELSGDNKSVLRLQKVCMNTMRRICFSAAQNKAAKEDHIWLAKHFDFDAVDDPDAQLSVVGLRRIYTTVDGIVTPKEMPMAISGDPEPIDQWRAEVERLVNEATTFGRSTPITRNSIESVIAVNFVTVLLDEAGSGKSTALLVEMTRADLHLVVRADLLWHARGSLHGDALQWATTIVNAHLATFDLKCDEATTKALILRVACGKCALLLDAVDAVPQHFTFEFVEWLKLFVGSSRIMGGLIRRLVIASRSPVGLIGVTHKKMADFDRTKGCTFTRSLVKSWAGEYKVKKKNTRSKRYI